MTGGRAGEYSSATMRRVGDRWAGWRKAREKGSTGPVNRGSLSGRVGGWAVALLVSAYTACQPPARDRKELR